MSISQDEKSVRLNRLKRISTRDQSSASALKSRLKAASQDHYERTAYDNPNGMRPEDRNCRPTAETESRLQPDAIQRMLKSGSLTNEQGWAAAEIHEIYTALQGSLFQRAAVSEQRSRGNGGIPERIAQRHRDHYLPWAHYLGGSAPLAPVGDHPGRPAILARCRFALELAIDVVIDGEALVDCERRRGWKRMGTASEVLRYALAVYTDVAGWERNHALMAAFEYRLGRRRVSLSAKVA